MAGWSIRRKLGLLVTIPLVVLLVGGGVLVASLGLQYRQAHTARGIADAIPPTLQLVQALDAEFSDPSGQTNDTGLLKLRNNTDARIAQVRTHLEQLSKGDPQKSNLPAQAQAMLEEFQGLGNTRGLVNRELPALAQNNANSTVAINHVNAATIDLRTAVQNLVGGLSGELGVVTPDSATSKASSFISSLVRMEQGAVAERSLFSNLMLDPGSLTLQRFSDLKGLQSDQDVAIGLARPIADPQQALQLTALTNQDSRLGLWRRAMQTELGDKSASVGDQGAWLTFSGERIDTINEITNGAAADIDAQAHQTENGALFRVAAVTGAVLLTLIVVAALLATIARTVTTPLRRLRAGAVDIASVQLPAAVARIEQDGVGADVSLPPVLPADALAGPETVEVARAVDDLGAEAVRLATAQVRLRRALDEAFVSMSRRSQSMVEKQLAIIDDLESQEQDPDQLRNLFRLDHLAARMRRYNDNLLVLAGSAVRTRATAPVKIAELFRAATSEMEQYERVRLQPVSGASIAGTVAGELVHLLAELLDNAAMYSPPSSAIVLSAAFTADGGLQIEVLDGGVGISPGELERLNGRLSQPEAIDTQVPSRMGLFVVARLARRGTFGVMLQGRDDSPGTIALVVVPATLVIGAPGSTGEQPAVASPGGRPAAVTDRSPEYPSYAPPALGAPQPPGMRELPAGLSAANSPAAAAAGVRSVADDGASTALPRRRRNVGTGATAGLPPAAATAAANPATGLFTPVVPPAPVSDEADRHRATGATAIGRPPAAAIPPETSPTGIGNIAAAPGRSGDLPIRNRQQSPTDRPHVETPAAGTTGLPGLAPPVRRGQGDPLPIRPGQSRDLTAPGSGSQPIIGADPLSTPTGPFRGTPNPAVPSSSNGDWDDLPTEFAARAAAAAAYRPSDPNLPMIGDDVQPDFNDPTPIFDQISVWFTSEPGESAREAPVAAGASSDQVIDLREAEEHQPSSRWAALGDQRWLATNARAAAAPDTEGTLETGLPKRRPGANLLPSAAAAAAAPVPPARPAPARSGPIDRPVVPEADDEQRDSDAAVVRGRLGSYQRGLANARRTRAGSDQAPAFDPVGASLFTANRESGDDTGVPSGEQGGDQ